MENTLYFAYGSNINLDQMAYRCPDASVVGPVTLENYELLFRRDGFATIAPKEGEAVTGLLWSITPGCERSLDRYEGYPRFYDKRKVSVRDSEGRSLSVMAYIMDERFREPILPTDSYYNGILEGYRQNDMPTDCLKRAWEHCVEEVHAMTEQVNSLFTQRSKPPKGRGSHER
ncbi:MAG: gamma-glutamylcyclotransferase [Oscillibacter sp.]|nr:gamma-glutamylcyclotransferase [Oscillibacter sp.]